MKFVFLILALLVGTSVAWGQKKTVANAGVPRSVTYRRAPRPAQPQILRPRVGQKNLVRKVTGLLDTVSGVPVSDNFLPRGNWSNECKNCRVSGDTFVCECLKKGKVESISRPLNNCSEFNYLGSNLYCAAMYAMPEGAYKHTCKGCFVDNNWLVCSNCVSGKGFVVLFTYSF